MEGTVMAEVSVIIPIYNVEKYLDECLVSVRNQTSKDIEIICVNDGSTDSSRDIVMRHQKEDLRIICIDGPNKGYGHAVNQGMDHASGEYIGIVEPDDYVDANMFKRLYEVAGRFELDWIKSDFYRFTRDEKGNQHNTLEKMDISFSPRYGMVLMPCEDTSVIRFPLNTWTGIYRREFISGHQVRHHETAGASFQDNGFAFQTMVHARRAMIIAEAFYMNRRDNPNSSVKSSGKVYTMNQEYDFIRDFLMEEESRWEKWKFAYWYKKYYNCVFTYNRIADEYKAEYRNWFAKDLRRAMACGEISDRYFPTADWEDLLQLTRETEEIRKEKQYVAGIYSLPVIGKTARFIAPVVPKSIKKGIIDMIRNKDSG